MTEQNPPTEALPLTDLYNDLVKWKDRAIELLKLREDQLTTETYVSLMDLLSFMHELATREAEENTATTEATQDFLDELAEEAASQIREALNDLSPGQGLTVIVYRPETPQTH